MYIESTSASLLHTFGNYVSPIMLCVCVFDTAWLAPRMYVILVLVFVRFPVEDFCRSTEHTLKRTSKDLQ